MLFYPIRPSSRNNLAALSRRLSRVISPFAVAALRHIAWAPEHA